MEIQAAVLRAADGAYAIEDVSLREPGPGELRVRVVGAGMCHTDVLPRAPGMLAGPADHHGPRGLGRGRCRRPRRCSRSGPPARADWSASSRASW